MDRKIITYVLTLLTVAELRSPQVHEEVNETPYKEPTNNQKFNFEIISQADRQKWRYMQQQAVDAWHQARNAGKNRRAKAPRKRNVNNLEEVEILTKDINHGLRYFDNSQSLDESANAQLKMLNSLIGQDPALQLEGLQKLLNAKDHTPITEDVIDVANPSNRPNVKVESGPPEFQKVVANVLVLQADAQRQIKEQNQLNLAEYERQLQAAQVQQVSNEQQLQHVILEEEHSTYGPVTNFHRRPQKSIYGDNQLQYAASYAFGYKVRDVETGNDFGHEEISDGKMRKGRYHVLLPDGRLQKVQYWADDSGYHAKVSYDRVALHPAN